MTPRSQGTNRSRPEVEEVLRALRDSDRGPLRAKDLARLLRIPQHGYREFRDFLRELEERGTVHRVKGNRYALPSEINLAVGTLQLTRAGDAFLRPDRGHGQEVFVPAGNLGSAGDGDRVTVRIEQHPRGRAPVGRVLKVLDRFRTTVVGTLHRTRGFAFVRPLDPRVHRDLLLEGDVASSGRDGDVVVVRITRHGDRRMNPAGEIERVLGPLDDPGVDVLAILYGHGLPGAFPPEVEGAARDAGARLQDPGPRTDLRHLLTFTIDPSDARDHDDALSVTELGPDLWQVGIHIADVSHFVPEGSPIDLEAFHRGTSVYLVDQVVPMLPHALSSDLCSLRAGEERLAVSLLLTLDAQGRVREHRFERSLLRCDHSLHYEQVQRVLEGTESIDPETDAALGLLDRLARVQRARRLERGSLDFDLPEARVILDEDGVPIDILRSVQMDSHRLIEDFMILANEVVARTGLERGLPIPFRVHEPPADDRGEELRSFLASVGLAPPRGALTPRALQQVLDRARGRPEESLVSTVLLRAMARARYDPENLGHFGLASKAYTHFTSPIRRYPDLVVHRVIVRTVVDGKPSHERWTQEALEEMTLRASERERVAQRAERDSVDLKKVEFMQRHLGADFEGTISGVTSFGFFVLLDRYFVEGLVHVSSLGDDYYVFAPERYELAGRRSKRRFRLGDRVRIQVVRASKEDRKLDFVFRERIEPAPPMPAEDNGRHSG